MIENNWIRKWGPEPFDADDNGKIVARVEYSSGYVVPGLNPRYKIPEHLVSIEEYNSNEKLVEWRRTENWINTHEEFEREIDQVACGDSSIVVLTKDGTMWLYRYGTGVRCWSQLPDLPKGVRKINSKI